MGLQQQGLRNGPRHHQVIDFTSLKKRLRFAEPFYYRSLVVYGLEPPVSRSLSPPRHAYAMPLVAHGYRFTARRLWIRTSGISLALATTACLRYAACGSRIPLYCSSSRDFYLWVESALALVCEESVDRESVCVESACVTLRVSSFFLTETSIFCRSTRPSLFSSARERMGFR